MSCGQCQIHLQANHPFCANCGQRTASLPASPPCPVCGAGQLPGSRFCGACWASLDRSGSTPIPPLASSVASVSAKQAPSSQSKSQLQTKSANKPRGGPGWAVFCILAIAALGLFVGISQSNHLPTQSLISSAPAPQSNSTPWTIPLDPSGRDGHLPPPPSPLGMLAAVTISNIEIHQDSLGSYGQRGIAITARVTPGTAFNGRVAFYFRLFNNEPLRTDDPEDQTPDHQLAVSTLVSSRSRESVPVSVFVPYSAFAQEHDLRSLTVRPSLFTNDGLEICRGIPASLEASFSVKH